MKTIATRTGKIFYDKQRKLEFLYVGDYGKENNIKSKFLGFDNPINGVKHKEVDLTEKLVVTISTQKGCPMKCMFCDVPKYGYYGNATVDELHWQIETALRESQCKHTKRLNIHFARMGEPTFNFELLDYTTMFMGDMLSEIIKFDTLHPVVSTMLPKSNKRLEEFILEWCNLKNTTFKGEAGLQLSINTTDELQRKEQFRNQSLSLQEISELSNKFPIPKGRKYTLNFAVTKDTILNAKELSRLFNKDIFIVKLTPIHETNSAIENGFDIDGYNDFDVYEKFETPLLNDGWEVIVFVPSKEEDEDRITCGNALISDKE